jgi:Flp pilus assembly pilin Flp
MTVTTRDLIRKFLGDDEGQDLVEYTLLLGFVCLASAALFIGSGQSLAGIWTTTNTVLVNANTAVSTS